MPSLSRKPLRRSRSGVWPWLLVTSQRGHTPTRHRRPFLFDCHSHHHPEDPAKLRAWRLHRLRNHAPSCAPRRRPQAAIVSHAARIAFPPVPNASAPVVCRCRNLAALQKKSPPAIMDSRNDTPAQACACFSRPSSSEGRVFVVGWSWCASVDPEGMQPVRRAAEFKLAFRCGTSFVRRNAVVRARKKLARRVDAHRARKAKGSSTAWSCSRELLSAAQVEDQRVK